MNNDHFTGFVAGVACTAVALHWYSNNRERIEEFMKAQELGMQAPGLEFSSFRRPAKAAQETSETPLTLEELLLQKEQLDDKIAELQAKAQAEAK